MIITQEQAKLLIDLSGQIQEKLNFAIGYSNPTNPTSNLFLTTTDFLIVDNPQDENLHCFYKDDLETKLVDQYLVKMLPEEPKHDGKVQELFDKVNSNLLEGSIWFDPYQIKVVDDLRVEVCKKYFPNASKDIFNTNIFTNKYGTVYTYDIIEQEAPRDIRFKIAKEIIDEAWPEVKENQSKPNSLEKGINFSAEEQKIIEDAAEEIRKDPSLNEELIKFIKRLFGM